MNKVTLFNTYTAVYYWIRDCLEKFIILQGGTSSSKTVSAMQYLAKDGIEWDGTGKAVVTVVAETSDSLKRGALRDFRNLIASSDLLFAALKNPHLVKGPYEFKSGSILEFVHLGKVGTAKHGKRRHLYLNEVNHLDYEVVDKMIGRTDGKIIMDYNSDANFWVHDEFIPREDAQLFISNFTHNPYVDESVVERLLSHKRKWEESGDAELREIYESIDSEDKEDKKRAFKEWDSTSSTYWRNKWYVEGLGLTGIVEGTIFKDVNWIKMLPQGLVKRAYVIDWGFNPDPTAIALCGMKRGAIYGKQLFYKTDQTTPQVMRFLRSIGVSKRDLIIADPANMDAITQMRRKGWNIVEANKPPGSIKSGITSLNGHELNITQDSTDWKIEQEKYKYKMKDGKSTGQPIDKWNHLWDDLRYYYHHWYPPKKAKKRTGRHRRRARIIN